MRFPKKKEAPAWTSTTTTTITAPAEKTPPSSSSSSSGDVKEGVIHGNLLELFEKLDGFTKRDVPVCCLSVVTDGPISLAVNDFILGKIELGPDFDFMPLDPIERNISPVALAYVTNHQLPKVAQRFPLTSRNYVDLILQHPPTIQASFTHALNSYTNDPYRWPVGVTKDDVLKGVKKLKKYNSREKAKRKQTRKTNKGTVGRPTAYYEGEEPPPVIKNSDDDSDNDSKKKKKKKSKKDKNESSDVEKKKKKKKRKKEEGDQDSLEAAKKKKKKSTEDSEDGEKKKKKKKKTTKKSEDGDEPIKKKKKQKKKSTDNEA